WVRFFTTRPARTIDDVRRMRTFTWAGNPRGEELWKQAGFHPVPLAPTDILDIKIAPIVGATVVSRAVWERIDPSLRPVLLRESELVGTRMRDRIRSLDGEAITAMRNR